MNYLLRIYRGTGSSVDEAFDHYPTEEEIQARIAEVQLHPPYGKLQHAVFPLDAEDTHMASMIDSLVKVARILCEDEQPNSDTSLQAMVGDPADTRTSTFVQFHPNPGTMQLPNPMSPVEGDEIFFAYMQPGSQFQAHDGSMWLIQNYTGPDEVEIYNIWYPRLQAIVSLNDVRRAIHQWTNPITQTVPPPPPGVDYGALPVKIVDGPERYGNADELTDYTRKTDLTGGW